MSVDWSKLQSSATRSIQIDTHHGSSLMTALLFLGFFNTRWKGIGRTVDPLCLYGAICLQHSQNFPLTLTHGCCWALLNLEPCWTLSQSFASHFSIMLEVTKYLRNMMQWLRHIINCTGLQKYFPFMCDVCRLSGDLDRSHHKALGKYL